MISKRNWKAWLALSVALAVIVASGSVTMASNMGFKINKALYSSFGTAGPPIGENLVSLPYNNPYPNSRSLCNAIGASGFAGVRIRTRTPGGAVLTSFCTLNPGHTLVSAANPASRGHFVLITCDLGGAGCPADADPGAPEVGSGILVGSSSETQVLPSITGGGVDNDISVPYHTTWTGAKDVCTTYGFATANQRVLRLNAQTGVFTTFFCSAGPPGFALVIGEGLIIRNTLAGVTAGPLPPHF
jgi:hypothetical protein